MQGRANAGRYGPMRLIAGVLLWIAAAVFAGVSAEAQVAVSPISDTVYRANGTAATGTVLVSWPAFTTAGGGSVPKGSTSITLGTGGSLTVSLAPNAGATPVGTYYTVVYHLDDGSTSREYWAVPVSTTPLKLSAVRAGVLPTSVALQTVTKQYVDQAIAHAVITGAAPQDASGSMYVEKAGDTMTGPLTLSGDPTAALQAATKNYVDTNVTGLQAGLSQKVSTIPTATQTVVQPAGTQLQVNNLNGELHAKGYSVSGNDGITNALSSSDCSAGCTVVADPNYVGTDRFSRRASASRLQDERGGAVDENFFNPQSPLSGASIARNVTAFSTASAVDHRVQLGGAIDSYGLSVTQNALAGGSNIFPENITSSTPYFKSTYHATATTGLNFTLGQHVLDNHSQRCFGVGDCLLGSQFLYSSGGQRDSADEGTHPFDIVISEDTSAFQGTCSSGCSTGSTQVQIAATVSAGTQGEGRFLIDKAPSKILTAGTLVGAAAGAHSTAVFSGTAFPVSTQYSIADTVLPQSTNIAPGTVTVSIKTSGVAGGYSTNTATSPAASGIACVADAIGQGTQGSDNFETVNFTVVDGTHIRFTFNKPHLAGATASIGGLCGYGIEQTVDEFGPVRQVFPVIGSPTATTLLYQTSTASTLGGTGANSAYANISIALGTLQRSGNVVTATTTGNLPYDVNGLTMTIAGVTDSSYNGSYVVTTTGGNQFTYTQTGANSTSNGGTAALLTGSYVLYPAAEVLSVYNPTTTNVDGYMKLAPNNVAWAVGDAVELPHYHQQKVNADVSVVTQYTPRPNSYQMAGVTYDGFTGAGVTGWAITNQSLPSLYFGNGGTRVAPTAGMAVRGEWTSSMELQAGDSNGLVFRCNSRGCGRWDSSYNLFALQSGASGSSYDVLNYAPLTSTLNFNMRGTQYTFSPTGFTAGTINATTLNVSRINGLQQASASAVGGVMLGASATSAVLANVASSGSAADLTGLARSATVDATNAANITSGTLDPARLPAGYGSSGSTVCASNVAYSATPTFAMTCSNATFHMPLTGNVTGQSFTGLAAGQHITLVFQVGSTAGYTVQWASAVHGGFVTSSNSAAAGYTQAGKYLVQQLVVDTDGVTLLNPGAINE